MVVGTWTVDKEEDMRTMINRGVDFITTNEPVLLQQVLETL
jgi:glycerophosphoryl diester phosphodiesterase